MTDPKLEAVREVGREDKLDYSGGGKISVPVSSIVASPKVQRQVEAVREIENAGGPVISLPDSPREETPNIIKMLRSGHCPPNMGCGMMTECVCAHASEAADHIESIERRLHEAQRERDKWREETQETELHEFVAYVMDSTMRRLEVVVVHASDARSLDRRLQEAQRENVEHAITQVEATRIIRELDAKLDTALRELAAERKDAERWREIRKAPKSGGRRDWLYMPHTEELDASIDAALAEKGKP